MPFLIRRLADADLDDVVTLSMRAWTPVFQSMRAVLAEAVYLHLYAAGGIRPAVVATGGDPGHAPARVPYEEAGSTGPPLVRYHQVL